MSAEDPAGADVQAEDSVASGAGAESEEGEVDSSAVEQFFRQFREDCARGVVEIEGADFERKNLSQQEIGDLEEKLRADTAFQTRVMSLQGLGEFVGSQSGKFVFVDRGPMPVVYAHVGPRLISITTDTPNRGALLEQVEALKNPPLWKALLSIHAPKVDPNYKTMMWAMEQGGFTLPVETRHVGGFHVHRPQGLVAAVQAVTQQPFLQKPSEKRFAEALLSLGKEPGTRDSVPMVGVDRDNLTLIMGCDPQGPAGGQVRRFVIG